MLSSIIAGVTSASLSVLSSIMTKHMFESVIRKLLAVILTKIVASTENTVDDDLVAPIIKELEK